MTPLDIIMALFVLGVGIYELINGIRMSNLSGYRFYLTAGIIVSAAFVLAAGILLFLSGRPLHGWEASVIVIWLSGTIYRSIMKKRAADTDPLRWKRWIEKLDR